MLPTERQWKEFAKFLYRMDPVHSLPSRQRRFRNFLLFHHANPEIYRLFLKYSLEAARAGRQRFGSRTIGERIRWYCRVDTVSVDGFKLNDHHWPYYARVAMLHEPILQGLFELRDKHFDADEHDLLLYVRV